MALITSHVWATVNGSIGGITYGNSKYGITARNRTKPIDPDTTNQQRTKVGMAYSVQNWNDVGETVRAYWNQYATTVDKVSKSGVVYKPSGRQLFIAFYSFIRYLTQQGHTSGIDNDMYPEAPGVIPPPTIQVAAPSTPSNPGFELQISNNLTGSPMAFYMQVGNVISAGRNSYRGPWNVATAAFNGEIDPETSDTQEFLGYEVGDRIPWRVRGYCRHAAGVHAGKLTTIYTGIATAVETPV